MERPSKPGAAPTFAESGAPPVWMRALMLAVIVGGPAAGLILDGSDGLILGCVIAGMMLFFALLMEVSQWLAGGVTIADGVLRVGRRRSVPVSALDLDTLGFTETDEIYAVFGSNAIKSNPIWLKHTVSVKGRRDGAEVSVMLKTNRPDELVAALRAAAA